MKTIKEGISKVITDVTEKIAINSACLFLWGETEMPQALRNKIESKVDNNINE